MTCSVCPASAVRGRLGFCYKHYKRFRRHGDALAGGVELGLPEIERIRFIAPESWGECLLWTGNINQYGYGRIKATNKVTVQKMVHRVVFEAVYGVLLPGEEVDHECHNLAAARGLCAGGVDCKHRRCINADHLKRSDMLTNLSSSPLTPQGGKVMSRDSITGRFKG